MDSDWQLEACSSWPVETLVGFVITDESFVLRIPAQCSSQLAGEVGQKADAGDTMAGFDRSIRCPARVDAVDPVLDVGSGHISGAFPFFLFGRVGTSNKIGGFDGVVVTTDQHSTVLTVNQGFIAVWCEPQFDSAGIAH